MPNPIEKLIDGRPMTRLQYSTIFICFLMNMLDGMDVLVISYSASSVAREWSILPEALGVVFSAGLMGMTLGALLIAPKTDVIGRRPMIMLSALLMGISIFLTAYSETIFQFIALRFMSGLGIGSMLASTPTLASEYAPERSKNFWVSFVMSGYPCGAVLSGLIAAYVIPRFGWQAMFQVAGALTIVTLPLIYFFLAESLEFLFKSRPRNALQKVNRILAQLKTDRVDNLPMVDEEAFTPSIKALFSSSLIGATLWLWLAFFAAFGGLYFLLSWIPKLAESTGLSLELAIYSGAVFNLGSFFGIVVQGYLSARFSLRWVIGVFLLCAAALMVVFGIFSNSFMILLVFGMIGFAIQGGFVGLYTVGARLYPTEIRTTGIGWAIGAGRTGAIAGPFFGGLLIGAGLSVATNFMVFAIPLVIAAAATLAIPADKLL